MTHVWAVILGVAQGTAEFLPISSTAHLKMLPWLFGMNDSMLSSSTYDIALHAGSLVALVLALWNDWVELLRSALGMPQLQRRTKLARFAEVTAQAEPIELVPEPMHHPAFARRFLGFLVATSVPGAVFGFLFEQQVEKYSTPTEFHGAPLLVGSCLIAFGVLLWAFDRYHTRAEPLQSMTWTRALVIGAAQALSLIPGVSRSGATMTAGRALGLSREATARYSFMAGLPIIAGAAVFGLRNVQLSQLLSLDWVLGFVAAAVTSVVLMRWMLEYVKRHSFKIFMWYRVALGVLLIVVFFVRG